MRLCADGKSIKNHPILHRGLIIAWDINASRIRGNDPPLTWGANECVSHKHTTQTQYKINNEEWKKRGEMTNVNIESRFVGKHSTSNKKMTRVSDPRYLLLPREENRKPALCGLLSARFALPPKTQIPNR